MARMMRIRTLNFLYALKENVKYIDAGFIINNGSANIDDLIKEGFAKLEYWHLLKTKEKFSQSLGYLGTESIDKEEEYALFSIYVTLIGFLDSFIEQKMKLYKNSILLAGKIALANDLRKEVLSDFASELQGKSDKYIEILSNPSSIFSSIEESLSSSEEQLFNMTGFYQAYMEGYKRISYVNVEEIIECYEKCRKRYVDYRGKCTRDLESVNLLTKENKPLL